MKFWYCLMVGLLYSWVHGQAQVPAPDLKILGVVLKVDNLEHAVDFYENTLGFKKKYGYRDMVALQTAGIQLWLQKVKNRRAVNYGEEAQAILTLQTNDLDSAITVLKEQGVLFIKEVKENGVGYSAPFLDSSGNVISLLEQTKFETARFQEPKIYNVGVYVPEIEKSKNFYCDTLGFIVRTTRYLPHVLPLNHRDGSLALILHQKAVGPTQLDFENDTQTNIVLGSKSLSDIEKTIPSKVINGNALPFKNAIVVQDPWGNNLIIQKTD